MILIMPLPQMLATTMMAMATMASHQQVEALDTAEGARFRPMRMMMGPVTTGGRKRMTFLHAHRLDDGGQHHVQQAGHHNAAAGVLELFRGVHVGVLAGVQLGHGLKAAQEGEGGAQEGGHLHLGAHVEEQGAEAGEEQGGLDGQGQAVGLDQDGHQHRGAEHGEHVLQAQDQHLGQAQHPGVPDGLAARRVACRSYCISSLSRRQKKSNCFFQGKNNCPSKKDAVSILVM